MTEFPAFAALTRYIAAAPPLRPGLLQDFGRKRGGACGEIVGTHGYGVLRRLRVPISENLGGQVSARSLGDKASARVYSESSSSDSTTFCNPDNF